MYKIIRKNFKFKCKIYGYTAPKIAKRQSPDNLLFFWREDGKDSLNSTDYDRRRNCNHYLSRSRKTTMLLGNLEEGDNILDFVGPLGVPTNLEGYKKVAVIGGGLGAAIAYPQAKKIHSLGGEVHTIIGFRNKDIVILEEEMKAVSSKSFVTTDDGSYGKKVL